LCGAQRTGKSTLAKLFAKREEYEFIEITTSQVFVDLKLDPKADYPFEKRIFIQRKILEAANKLYCSAGGLFISDRTPIDMLAYTFADVTRQNVNGALEKEIEAYTNDCFEVLNRHFALLMLVQPGIPLIEEIGKAPATPAYMEHINYLVFGLMISERTHAKHYYIPRSMLDLEERFAALCNSNNKVLDNHDIAVASGNVLFY
jgi:hypothetical protein